MFPLATTFLADIQRRLITQDNPDGDLTNSDLEQAGVAAHLDVTA